jgi:hypothetical protein
MPKGTAVGEPHIMDYTSLLGAHLLGLLVCLTTSSACLIRVPGFWSEGCEGGGAENGRYAYSQTALVFPCLDAEMDGMMPLIESPPPTG